MAEQIFIDNRVVKEGLDSFTDLKSLFPLNEHILRVVQDEGCCGGGTNPNFGTPIVFGNYQFGLNVVGDLTLNGVNFGTNTVITITGGTGNVVVNSVTYVSPTQLIVNISSDNTIDTYTITATNGNLSSTQTDNLSVEDLDAIRRSLIGGSIAAYDAANNGDWIAISEAEWDNLKVEVLGANTFGTSDADQRTGPLGNFAAGQQFTFGHNTNPSLANQYFFAFRFGASRPMALNNKIRISSTGVNQWLQVGTITQVGVVDNNFQYYVLKGNSSIMPVPSYLGLTTNSTDLNVYFDVDNTEGLRSGSDTDDPTTPGFGWSMSGLSTNSIQWTT